MTIDAAKSRSSSVLERIATEQEEEALATDE